VGAMVGIQGVFRCGGVRMMQRYHGLVLGMVRRVRFGMGCGVVPGVLVIASAVLARARRGQVPGRFFPMVVLMFTVYFHNE
jgi:hypothetical protein